MGSEICVLDRGDIVMGLDRGDVVMGLDRGGVVDRSDAGDGEDSVDVCGRGVFKRTTCPCCLSSRLLSF